MNKLFVPFLPPWAETGLQPAFYDLESGTVLQQVSRMYAKVNQLIRNFNDLSKETKDTVEEYIAKFIELKDFVDDYFDNLDVQEEVNNKIDAMAEDGTLAELLNSYVDGYYYPEVKISEHKHSESGTTYYIAEVPALDNNGDAIKAKLGYADDSISNPQNTETVRQYANRKGTTLATNASYFSVDSSSPIYHKPLGIGIHNGTTIYDNSAFMPDFAVGKLQYFAIMEDGTFKAYTQDYSSQQMIDDGVKEAFMGQIPIIVDGENYLVEHPDLPTPIDFNTRDQFTVWGQKEDKSIVVLVCNGDGYSTEKGLTLMEIANILLNDYDVNFAMSLDGGGSSQFVYQSYLMNYAGDAHYTEERKVPVMIYLGKDIELNDFQKMELETRKIDGDSKYKADNNINFKTGYIRLTNLPNITNPGIEAYHSGLRNKLSMRDDAIYYQHFDENGLVDKNLFWAKENGLIATVLGDHAFIPNRVGHIDKDSDTTISDINATTISHVPSRTDANANGDEPYTDSYAFVITIAYLGGEYRQQYSIPIGNGVESHNMLSRIYYPESSTWSNWKNFDDTGWVSLTTTKGSAEYRRIGRMVEVRGSVNSGESGILTNLPAEVRPSVVITSVANSSGNNMAKVFVVTDGNLSLNPPDVAGTYSFCFNYMLD